MSNIEKYTGSVEVLILTYNGERYIRSQLESILNQLSPSDRVIVSDDGSTDSTVDIIREVSEESAAAVEVFFGPGQGVVQNFFHGISRTTAGYVLLSDQDDIWLSDKLHLFRERMMEVDFPHLIFSDAVVWYPESDSGRKSFWVSQNISPEHAKSLSSALFRNCVQGASMALNRSLVSSLEYQEDIVMFDWWCALVACAQGLVDFVPNATLLYRQHDSNQIGLNMNRSISDSWEASKRIVRQVLLFERCYSAKLGVSDAKMLKSYSKAVESGWFLRLMFLIRYRPIRSTWLRTFTLWGSVLLIGRNILVPN